MSETTCIDINHKRPPYGVFVKVITINGTEDMAAFGDNGWYFEEWGDKAIYPTFDDNQRCTGPVLFWFSNNTK